MIEEIVEAAPICNEQIKVAVVVVITPGTTHRQPNIIDDVAGSDLGETAVTVVAIEEVSPCQVTHEQIQIPVVVIISPNSAQRISTIIDDGSGGNLAKGAVAVVA